MVNLRRNSTARPSPLNRSDVSIQVSCLAYNENGYFDCLPTN